MAILDKIEGLYKRAVHADPANANNFSNFGLFLAEVNVRLARDLMSRVATKSSLYNLVQVVTGKVGLKRRLVDDVCRSQPSYTP